MRLALALLLVPLATPTFAAPQVFACTFERTTRPDGEPRRAATELLIDTEAKLIELHAPDGNWTYDNAAELGRRLTLNESDGNLFGAGDAEKMRFSYTFKQPETAGAPRVLTWATFSATLAGGRSTWLCRPAE